MASTNEFAGMDTKEILAILGEERTKLRDMTLKISLGQMRSVRAIRDVKKRIARLETRLAVIATS